MLTFVKPLIRMETSKGGYQHLLVLTDHFTRYAQAYPTRNMTAKTTAEVLFNNFFIHYGFPARLHSDQGPNFDGKLVHELCQIAGIRKSRTTPYHPSGNGMCARFNRTVLNMLGTLNPEQKSDWKKHVGPLVHAYNCTRHEQTGFSPFLLMFGRKPRLPVDLAFGIERGEKYVSHSKYVDELRTNLKSSYELATRSADKARDTQKDHYDRRIRGATVQCGDRVLVKRLVHEGKHKLANKWEDMIYVVTEQTNPDVPVFVVKPETGNGRTRKLHSNLLLPVGELFASSDTDGEDVREPVFPGRPKPKPTRNPRVTDDKVESETDDDEDGYFIVINSPAAAVTGTPSRAMDDTETDEDPEVTSRISDDPLLGEAGGEEGADDDRTSTAEVDPTRPREDFNPPGGERTASDNAVARSPEQPVPIPRKSDRTRRPPKWQTSETYAMRQTPTQPNWKMRAAYLQELTSGGNLNHMPEHVLDSLLSIITGGT